MAIATHVDRETVDTFTSAVLRYISSSCAKLLQRELDAILDQQFQMTQQRGYLQGFRAFTPHSLGKPLLELLPADRPTALLPAALQPQHDSFVANLDQHRRESGRIAQGITSILLRARTDQELRDLLPDHVLGPVRHNPIIAHLDRSMPSLETSSREEWARLPWDDRLLAIYAGIAPYISTYMGYTLL